MLPERARLGHDVHAEAGHCEVSLKRRRFLLGALAVPLVFPSAAQNGRVYPVGVLLDDPLPAFQAFRDRLRQLAMPRGRTWNCSYVLLKAISRDSRRWQPIS